MWKERYAIGVSDIDNQHKELFEKYDQLLLACKAGKGKGEVLEVMVFLEDYVHYHFSAEENLQKNNLYPAYPGHKEKHEKYIKELADLKNHYTCDGISIADTLILIKKLSEWLINHIGVDDKALGTFLNEKKEALHR